MVEVMFKILFILFLLFVIFTFGFSLLLKKMKRMFIGDVKKSNSEYKKHTENVIYDDGVTKVLKGKSKN